MLDWSEVRKKPSKKQLALYKAWVAYLKDSRLTEQQIQSRAMYFAEMELPIPNGD